MNALRLSARTLPLACCLVLLTLSAAHLPAQTQFLGDLDTDGQATVLDLTRLISHLNGANQLSPALAPYGDLNEDGVINTNDLQLLQNAILGLGTLPNPYSAPVLDALVTATNGTSITISGVARPNRRILITGGRFAVFVNADASGRFTASVELRGNQLNNLYVTASSSNFLAGIPQPLRILQDSQPPNLYLDFPTNGQTLYTSNTVIAGRVGDMLSGFMGLAVTLNSQPSTTDSFTANVNVGIGNNGTFERSLVPLAEGTNEITVTATDAHGNSTFRVVRVFRGQVSGPQLLSVSGDLQATNVHRRLAQPIVVRAVQADGVTPFVNKLVTLEVTRSDGRLLPAPPSVAADVRRLTNDITRTVHGVMHLDLLTDANGEARAWWALGGDAGRGNNRVCAMSAGISNTVYFCASARPAAVNQINIGTGNNQKAEVGGQTPEPLRAWVNDSCNGIEGLPITFTIVQGGGRLFPGGTSSASPTNDPGTPGTRPSDGVLSLTIPSAITGHAEAILQLGPDAGANLIEATYPGNPGLPATFIAYGVARDPSKPTTLTGLLLDNTSCPIGGAVCSVSVGGQLFFTTTDAQGQFHFGPGGTSSTSPTNPEPQTLPSGPAQLFINGSTATNLLGATIPTNSFPSLEFALILIPNAENSLPSAVLLPRLNPNNQRLYHGTNDLMLTCEGMEGLKMTIKANSMRKPDGTLVTPDNPAMVSLNQVHHDNVPMPIPDGASPPFAWTLQPGGATFSPPIQIEYPNMSGLPAGTVAYFLSYNHDTRRFEIIATGHVQDDSVTIVTDPGAGLAIAGWGCNCPPYSVIGGCNRCPDPFETRCWLVFYTHVEKDCVPHTVFKSGSCDDDDACTVNDQCQNGVCRGDPIRITTVKANANGLDRAFVCLGQTVNFSVPVVEQQNCSGLEYKWKFNDAILFETESSAQSPPFTYQRAGTYNPQVEVNCSACPSAKKSGSVTVSVIKLDSLKPSEGVEIDDGDGDENSKSYFVCKAPAGTVTIVATPIPAVTEADLPIGWILTGGSGGGRLQRTVDKTISGAPSVIQANCGANRITVTIYIVEVKVVLASAQSCDGTQVNVDLVVTPEVAVFKITDIRLEATKPLGGTSFDNPAGLGISFSQRVLSTQWQIDNVRWYSTQADHCNLTSDYKIRAKMRFGGLFGSSSLECVSDDVTFTADGGDTCIDGVTDFTGFFAGGPSVSRVFNPATGMWEATVGPGTFVRSVTAIARPIFAGSNSQFYDQVKKEEEYHRDMQLTNPTHPIMLPAFVVANVMSPLLAGNPYTGGTEVLANTAAEMAYHAALIAEITRSDAYLSLPYPPGSPNRCALEREAKAAVASSHLLRMQCAYPLCCPPCP